MGIFGKRKKVVQHTENYNPQTYKSAPHLGRLQNIRTLNRPGMIQGVHNVPKKVLQDSKKTSDLPASKGIANKIRSHKEQVHNTEKQQIKKSRVSKGIQKVIRKAIYWIMIFTVIIILYNLFKDPMINLMKGHPLLWGVYSHIHFQIAGRTLLGLFYYSFLSSLFFIFLPIEIIFFYYSTLEYNLPIVISVTIAGNLLGMCFNYFTGRVIGMNILKGLMKKKFDRFHNNIVKFGGAVVFFGNIILFPIELASLVFGAAKYPFRKFFLYSFLGKSIKFAIIIWGRGYFTENVLPWLSSII